MWNLQNILKLRFIILLISKIAAIIFCVYYMIHAKEYHVSWSLFDWLMPTYLGKINRLLSNIGTFILIIPLTVIVGSIIMPEYTLLHLMSSLFGIMSILITTIMKLSTDNITEVTNFRLFKVSSIISLAEKRDIFVTECYRIINEKYICVKKLYDFLMKHFNNKEILQYDTMLENLNLPSQIRQYSQGVVIDLVEEFNKQGLVTTVIPWKNIIIGCSIIITMLVGTAIVNALVTDWAPTIKGTIEVVQDIARKMPNVMSLIKTIQERLLGLQDNIASVATQCGGVNRRVDLLTKATTMMYGILKRIVTKDQEPLLLEAEEIMRDINIIP